MYIYLHILILFLIVKSLSVESKADLENAIRYHFLLINCIFLYLSTERALSKVTNDFLIIKPTGLFFVFASCPLFFLSDFTFLLLKVL